MKNTLKLSLIVAVLVIFSACERSICIKGNGERDTRNIDVADFTGVELDGSFDVVILQGNRFKVEAIGDENILESIHAREVGGVCKLDLNRGCYKDYKLTIEVTMPELTDVFLDGSGDFTIEDFNNINTLNLEISGSGSIELYDLSGLQNINSKIDGSGDINFKRIIGGIDNVKTIINGSGDYNGFGLQADNVITRISGSGTSEVNASTTLNATIEGSGNILYKGTPTISKSITGSGSLINAN
ncbi:MAG: hypothetical protein COA58_11885 [Bacteroidetes bacterium]|nr:MAG: hypothetical protein COA58_11885 [Bacteroidota bacterium]